MGKYKYVEDFVGESYISLIAHMGRGTWTSSHISESCELFHHWPTGLSYHVYFNQDGIITKVTKEDDK